MADCEIGLSGSRGTYCKNDMIVPDRLDVVLLPFCLGPYGFAPGVTAITSEKGCEIHVPFSAIISIL